MKEEVIFWLAFVFLCTYIAINSCMLCVAWDKIKESKWYGILQKYLRQNIIKKGSHELNHTNQEICERLDEYLRRENTNYAVFINGGWGSGKTYFINNQYKNRVKIPCYVSLYGVNDKKEFEHRLWKGLIFPLKQKISVLLLSFLCKFIFLLFLLGEIWKLTDEYFYIIFVNIIQRCAVIHDILFKHFHFDFISLTIKLFSLAIFKWTIPAGVIVIIWKFLHFNALKIFLHNRYLVLDDFERAEAPCDEVLSWINEYVEHLNCHTIIVGNEDEVIENINRNHTGGNDNDRKLKIAGTFNIQNKTQVAHDGVIDFIPPFSDESNVFVQHYHRVKEKVIRYDFNLDQNNRIVCIKLLEKLKRYKPLLGQLITYEKSMEYTGEDDINILIEKVLKPINNYGINNEQNIENTAHEGEIEKLPAHLINYRAIERCFEEFEYYFGKVSSSEAYLNFISNQEHRHELLFSFISLLYFKSIYALEYFIDENEEQTENNPDEKFHKEYISALRKHALTKIMDEKQVNHFLSVYDVWNGDFLLPENIWLKIYNSNDVKHEVIENELQNYYVTHIPSEPTLTERLREMNFLVDSQLDDLKNDIENEFIEPKIASFSQFTSFVNLVCLGIQKDLFNGDKNDFEDKLKKYVENIFEQENFTAGLSDYTMYIECEDNLKMYEDDVQPNDQSLKSNVIKLIKEKLKKIKHDEKKTDYEEMLSKIQEGADVFIEWYIQKNRIYKDYFSSDTPQENAQKLWNILKDNKVLPKDFQNIMDHFHSHVANRQPDNPMKASEIEFWRNFILCAKKDMEEWEKDNSNRNKRRILGAKINYFSNSLEQDGKA